nr:HD domain-containing phosphohydrolase [Marinithermus hydrothermalis]
MPDRILLKPGRLSPAERRVIEAHTLRGEAILKGVPGMPRATLLIVRHHHERWDGTGYPDGLMGEAIPLGARLFSVIDVYDALISQRPYKPAWPVERALEEIRRQAGRQFDPMAVEVFLEALNETPL